MKIYKQLTADEQKLAREKILCNLLYGIVTGAYQPPPSLRERVDAAIEKAESMQTPWFVGEYIMDTCHAELEEMALQQAEEALYVEPHETVVTDVCS